LGFVDLGSKKTDKTNDIEEEEEEAEAGDDETKRSDEKKISLPTSPFVRLLCSSHNIAVVGFHRTAPIELAKQVPLIKHLLQKHEGKPLGRLQLNISEVRDVCFEFVSLLILASFRPPLN
jgi:hypothetical protein